MHRIDDAERRARIARRHHLAVACRATTVVDAAADNVGLHATDPVSVYLAAFARTHDLAVADVDRALYDERSLLKVLAMRRTMFVVPPDLAAIVTAGVARLLGDAERRRLVSMIEGAGIAPDGTRWLEAVEAETVAALEAAGEASAAELTKAVPGLREQILFGEGKRWQGTVGVSTRLLFLLATEGRIIRGRPRGSIVSSLYRWAPMDRWVREPLPDWPTAAAQVELVRRWLARFGPGTIDDLRWWTGWTLRDVRRALAALDTAEVALDGAAGLVLAGDVEPVEPVEPWLALLPALDPTVMGWTNRAWYLGDHTRALFDRNGNAGPTIWVDGRVVGGWAQRSDGEVVLRFLEDVGAEATAAAEAEAARIEAWLDDVRVIPRFRTPLEVELSAWTPPLG